MENDVERTDEDASRQRRQSNRNSRKKRKDTSDTGLSKISLIRYYRFEIFALFLLLLGVFLLVERLEIKTVIYQRCMWLMHHANAIWSYFASVIVSVQKSDLVGLFLMLVSIILIAWRVRFRAIQKYKHLDDLAGCPECGQNLRRLAKKRAHRLLELLFRVHIRRYSCEKCTFKASPWHS